MNWVNIASDNGLSPGRRQAIIWTNAGIFLIGPLRTNFSEILIEIWVFSFKKMRLKMSSATMMAILSRGRWVGTHLTKSFGAHNRGNILAIVLAVIFMLMVQSGHKFAHVCHESWQLSCHHAHESYEKLWPKLVIIFHEKTICIFVSQGWPLNGQDFKHIYPCYKIFVRWFITLLAPQTHIPPLCLIKGDHHEGPTTFRTQDNTGFRGFSLAQDSFV